MCLSGIVIFIHNIFQDYLGIVLRNGGLAQQNGFGPVFLHPLKGRAKPNTY
jgi:hypothetical protein